MHDDTAHVPPISRARSTPGAASRHFLRASSGSLAVRVASLGLVFGCHVLLSRALGVRGYGVYAYALAWYGALIVPATLGSERLIVRRVAAYHARREWEPWRGLLAWALRSVTAAALGIALVACAVAWLAGTESELLGAFVIAMLMLPLAAVVRVIGFAIQGMHRTVTGQLAEGIVYPLVFIALLAGALAWTRVLAAAGAMALNGAALLAALVCAAVLARHVLPASVRHAAPGWRDASWAATIAPLVIVSGVQAASGQIPVLIAGAVGSAEMAGVLSVAKRLADLAALPAIAAGAVLTPALARAWATRDLDGFQRAFTHFARGVTLATLPLAIGLIVFRAPLLGLFGASFARGGTALVVLCVGHVANVAVGSVSLALVMADHEREAAWIGAAAALLNAALCAVAVPRWGIEGAAAAAVVTLIVWNVWLAVRVWRLLGIRPTILARTRRRDVTG